MRLTGADMNAVLFCPNLKKTECKPLSLIQKVSFKLKRVNDMGGSYEAKTHIRIDGVFAGAATLCVLGDV